jgi:excisionase family DNA binding protein
MMDVMPEEFMTVEEVATLLRLSVETVKRLLRQKQIPGYKIGGTWRIDRSDFAEYLAKRKNIQTK